MLLSRTKLVSRLEIATWPPLSGNQASNASFVQCRQVRGAAAERVEHVGSGSFVVLGHVEERP